jgi:enoyl-CoA hydratase/carnithine racemase
MAAFQTLLFEKRHSVAHISLNRPQVLNAYNVQMRDDLSEVLAAVQEDSEVRAILLTGEGRAFCAGADLSEFGTAPSQDVARRVRWERDVWGQLIGLTKPVVAAIHGYCIGSGVEIALLCDIVMAAEGTIYAMPEVHLGMIPAAGGTQSLPRHIGASATLDLLFTGRRFDSQEALRLGLVSREIPQHRLRQEAWEVTNQLAGLEPALTFATKSALLRGADLPLEQALKLERQVAAEALT